MDRSRLDLAVQSRVNAALDSAGFDGDRNFQTLKQGLSKISSVLSKYSLALEPYHLNETSSGRKSIRLAGIEDSTIHLGWYQDPSGFFEVVAFLS